MTTPVIGSTCNRCGQTGLVGVDFARHINSGCGGTFARMEISREQLRAAAEKLMTSAMVAKTLTAPAAGGLSFGSITDANLYRSGSITLGKISAGGRDTLLPGELGGPPVEKNSKLAAARAARGPSNRHIDHFIKVIELDPYLSDVEKRILTNRIEQRPTDVEVDVARDQLKAEGLYP